MKRFYKYLYLVSGLLFLFYFLFRVHVAIFHKSYEFMYYLLMDIAFLPIEVLLVTLVVDKLLAEREKKAVLDKLMMVVGVFFSETGTELLKRFSKADSSINELRQSLIISVSSDEMCLKTLKKTLLSYKPTVILSEISLLELKILLVEKRDFLTKLLENPILLEHEAFTDLLQSVFHLTEELSRREHVDTLHPKDAEHITIDVHRAYTAVLREWGAYMAYLKRDYPYLFSFAVRTNPFNEQARVEID